MQIVILVALVVSYHWIILGFKINSGVEDSPARHNIRIIETYEAKRKPAYVVALGSSIFNRVAVRISQDIPKFENLCLVGFSAVDGTAVIEHRGRYPKLAVIELSTMLGKKERLDVETEVPAYKVWLSRYTPIVRSDFAPSAILLRKLVEHFGETKFPSPQKRDEIRIGVRKTIASTNLPRSLEQLSKSVRRLEQHGTTVCFVVLPLGPTILPEHARRKQMTQFEQYFPKSKNRWIEWSGPPRAWKIPDGWHLARDDAKIFADDLVKQLAPIWKSVRYNKTTK